MTILLKDCLAVDPSVNLHRVVSIKINNGIIEKVADSITDVCDTVIDCHSKYVVTPGLMDMHVHLRDPGLTYKEDIITGTSAAAAGGFTSVACMPNTKPVIDSEETISYIKEKAEKTGINVYPIACITKGMLGKELCDYRKLLSTGAVAFSDDGRPVENGEVMRLALEKAKECNTVLISHCEDLSIINGGIINKGRVSEKLGVKGMDRASEDSITAREIALAMSTDAHIHIAHVSTYGAVQFIRDAKKNGVNVTCETCPHYFMYTEDKLLSRDADYRMSPPLRTENDRKAIMDAVCDGTIDCIVTDHAPHSATEKSDFKKAPNGVVGLETSLSAVLTSLYHTGKITLDKLVTLMSINPRKILGLESVSIKEGCASELTVTDTEKEWAVDPLKLHSKSHNSVFKGEKFKGRAIYTITPQGIIYKI